MNHTTQHTWQPDESQQKVIGMVGGRHLVLAPPGCGKTQILAERVRHAHAQGMDYDAMLCLTFTNRAARGMRERIQRNIDDAGIEQIFVGNVHRFCSHFLFENRVVPAESAIIDEDTVVSILANYLQEDEGKVQANFNRRRAYSEIMFFSHLMEEIKMGLPRELRQHPDCATPTDVQVMRALCRAVGKEFTADQMVDIYEHNDYYVDVARSAAFDAGLRQVADRTLFKMKYAHAYTAYKQQYNLLDFEDLLIKTYATLRGGTPASAILGSRSTRCKTSTACSSPSSTRCGREMVPIPPPRRPIPSCSWAMSNKPSSRSWEPSWPHLRPSSGNVRDRFIIFMSIIAHPSISSTCSIGLQPISWLPTPTYCPDPTTTIRPSRATCRYATVATSTTSCRMWLAM